MKLFLLTFGAYMIEEGDFAASEPYEEGHCCRCGSLLTNTLLCSASSRGSILVEDSLADFQMGAVNSEFTTSGSVFPFPLVRRIC